MLLKSSLLSACILIFSGCSGTPEYIPVVSHASNCNTPTTADGTNTGIAEVAVRMRQALEECNRRNGYE